MLNWFRKSTAAGSSAPTPPPKARGIQPTYVTDNTFVLCKSCSEVRNTYEARVALYFAVTGKRRFILEVPLGASVDASLRAKVLENGGEVREAQIKDFSVFLGHESNAGAEGDGWVLGDSAAWAAFRAALPSKWLKDRLIVGAALSGPDLLTLQSELAEVALSQTNIDNENVKDALLSLVRAARDDGGKVYVQ
jgi:hypothetical protein